MPPQSRGPQAMPMARPHRLQSKSTPNLKASRAQPAMAPALPSLPSSGLPILASIEILDRTVDHKSHAIYRQSRPLQVSSKTVEKEPSEESDSGGDVVECDDQDDEEDSQECSEDDEGTTLPRPDLLRVETTPLKRPLYSHFHSRSYTHLSSTAFAPPFYNRPPTPLPPSPSLTSLLRPAFGSAQNTRPNTPDPSSDEAPSQQSRLPTIGTRTPASLLDPSSTNLSSTLISAPPTTKPIPRASPRVPTYEYYGFTLYLTSSLAFFIYLLWSFLPSPFLHQLGFYYYPNRWWALAIPAWLVVLGIYIYVALASYNTGYLTLSMDKIECLVDEAANLAILDEEGNVVGSEAASWTVQTTNTRTSRQHWSGREHGERGDGEEFKSNTEFDWKTRWNEGTDAVMDVPIGGICQILYG